MTKGHKRVLVYVEASWGEIHWIIPVLSYLRSKGMASVDIFINSYKARDLIGNDDGISTLLSESVENIYDWSHFIGGWRTLAMDWTDTRKGRLVSLQKIKGRMRKYLIWSQSERFYRTMANAILNSSGPQVLLRDTGGDIGLRKELIRAARKRNTRVIIMPHGTDFEMEVESTMPPRHMEGDTLLCPSRYMMEYYNTVKSDTKKVVVGNPRYDGWWVRHVLERAQGGQESVSEEDSMGTTILFITRGPHPQYLSQKNFEYLVRAAADAVMAIPGAKLLVRPHPRQSLAKLQELLSGYDRDRWFFDDRDIFTLSDKVSLVISMWSSMILDSIVAGLPVIEFYRFDGSALKWRRDERGNETTTYRRHQLVYAANTRDELESHIGYVMKYPKQTASEQYQKLSQVVALTEYGATKNVVKIIISNEIPIEVHSE